MNMKLSKNKLVGALLRIAVVIALLVLVDLCFGGASAWLYHRSKYGIFHRQQYVLNESKDDIINRLDSIGYIYDSNLNKFIEK